MPARLLLALAATAVVASHAATSARQLSVVPAAGGPDRRIVALGSQPVWVSAG